MLGQKTATLLAVSGTRRLWLDGDHLVLEAFFVPRKPIKTRLPIPKGHGKIVFADIANGVAIHMESGVAFHCVGREFVQFADAYDAVKS